jgi:DNA repair protein RadD
MSLVDLREILQRADETVFKKMMPEGVLEIILAIDPKNVLNVNAARILLNIRTPQDLLENQDSRIQILDLLEEEAAERLAASLGLNIGTNVYDVLKNHKFRAKRDKEILYGFFGLQIEEKEENEVVPSVMDVEPRYGLFGHQFDALCRVDNFLNKPPYKVLLHMPTGSGKTRTAMNYIVNFLKKDAAGIVIWLAQSEELCSQAVDEYEKAWGALGIRKTKVFRYWGPHAPDLSGFTDGILVGGFKKIYEAIVGGAPQLLALTSRRLLIVVDEAHSSIAPTYQFIIEHLMLPGYPTKLLGLSATPGRTWNNVTEDRNLSEFYGCQKVSLRIKGYDSPINYLIKENYLASPKFIPLRFEDNIGITDEERRIIEATFELPNSILRKISLSTKRNLLIIHHAEELLKRHKRIILFAASVDQSHAIAAVLHQRGYWAKSISSDISHGRAEIISDYKREDDESKILCNYGVLTAGFDAPKTSAAIIARPTLSLVLYSQMIGRAMRGTRAGGNKDCEILTVVDTNLQGFDSVVNQFENWEDVWRVENDD